MKLLASSLRSCCKLELYYRCVIYVHLSFLSVQSGMMQVGYIVMREHFTGARTNLLRMKGAEVVGVYHRLIDEKLVKILRRYVFY